MQLMKFSCSYFSKFGLIFVFIFQLIKCAARELDKTTFLYIKYFT